MLHAVTLPPISALLSWLLAVFLEIRCSGFRPAVRRFFMSPPVESLFGVCPSEGQGRTA